MAFRVLSRAIGLLLALRCRKMPEDFNPGEAGDTLDAAAIGCLDWAWYTKSHTDEVAGWIHKTPTGYSCSHLTVGTPYEVTVYIPTSWRAFFHTHSLRNTHVSRTDMDAVRADPQHRPSYIRLRPGAVIAYECKETKKGKLYCSGRRIR